ncbi:MAG: hypothetical protein ACI38U_00290 [Corynebacterium sp.]|uniref:hypothetical protein n=1 Tax=Corynebacterium sp. TaxID=1720 RepID=UPI003EFE6EEE
MDWAQELVSGGVNLVIGLAGVVVGSIITGAGEKSRIRDARVYERRTRQLDEMIQFLTDMESLKRALQDGSLARSLPEDQPGQASLAFEFYDRTLSLVGRARRYARSPDMHASLNKVVGQAGKVTKVADGLSVAPTVDDESAPLVRWWRKRRGLPPEPVDESQPAGAGDVLALHVWVHMVVGVAQDCVTVAQRELDACDITPPAKGTRRRAVFRFVVSAAIGAAVVSGPMLLM